MKCIVEIHCGGPQHLVVRKNESECMILSSACHVDVKWQFKRLSAAELCDFGCFLVLACGVILLSQTDISLIYHMVRGQGTIKLYMIYNVLECFLLQLISSGQAEKSTSFSSSMMRIFQHGLLRQRDKEAPRLTESGFQFLLMDTNAQLWYIIREYISNSEVYLMR
ncbi:uncharacterized protein LOC105764191 isoform X2 [Gossypium raimondii]|uniref:uncharacterized protein LOC105764191 isoform X2 n=1 Tax=Gossypium raimondii TaxID=29730 RepID=UPI00227A04D7|nr:uncharacterized protein LOC105764191 isoform X2 [Gossypium raimondii]